MKRYSVALLLLGALACTDSNAPPVHKPGSFGVLPLLDTVAAGVSVTFVAERSTVDAWQVSDTSVARIEEQQPGWARVMTLAAGTVTIKAKSQGDSGQATLVIFPPPPDTGHHSGFTISPALDTVLLGELVTFETSDANLSLPTEWSLSDSALAWFGWHGYDAGSVYTRAAGTLTITASHAGGDTARATLVIREPQPGEWESIDLAGADTGMGGQATAIADDGTIIGSLACGRCASPPGSWQRGFIYKDGVLRRLPSQDSTDVPRVIGPSGKIAGTWARGVSEWDTPDALPRHLSLEAGEWAEVVGVNEQGEVLFTATTRDFHCDCRLIVRARAVLWRQGSSVDLGSLGDSTIEPWTEAKAWNAKGQIVGRSHVRNRGDLSGDFDQFFHPFVWENGVMRDLGVLAPLPCPPGGPATDCSWGEAVDINASGVIVGNVTGADGKGHPVIWEHGVIRDLGVSAMAMAINDRGQVLMLSWGETGNPSILLWENGQIQSTGLNMQAVLGPNGDVIGGVGVWGWGGHGFVWEAGQLTDLGEAEPLAINGRGEIVGASGGRVMLWRKKR